MSSDQDRDAALANFETCRTEFEEAVRRAPDAALRFRPEGEDYSLGGLVPHVTDVLRRYGSLLEEIRTADWQPFAAKEHPTPESDARLIHDGFGGDQRAAILGEMRAAHVAFAEGLHAAGPERFARQAAVTYAGSNEPYPTSPADVLGWVRDHYREHTTQIADLVTVWANATR